MEFGVLLLFGLILVIAFLLKAYSRSPSRSFSDFPAQKTTGYLSTPAEREFHAVLRDVLDDRYTIHSQVSLIAVVQPVDWKHASRSWAKRLDFVITDVDTKIVAVVELDDSSHRRKKRVERDAYVTAVLKDHYPLIRVIASRSYQREAISALLLPYVPHGDSDVVPETSPSSARAHG